MEKGKAMKKQGFPGKIYVLLFLGTSLPFGIIMGLIQWPALGPAQAVKIGLWAGAAFGLIVTAIAGPLHAWSKRKSNAGGSGDNVQESDSWRAGASQSMEVRGAKEKLFQLALSSLAEFDKLEIKNQDPEQGIIEAETGQTWKSWGEQVRIRFEAVSPDQTRVEAASRSAVKTTLIDFGKNRENVQRILAIF